MKVYNLRIIFMGLFLILGYHSLGNITVWCRYFANKKIAELHFLTKLTRTMRKYLYNYEQEIFYGELLEYTSNVARKENFDHSTSSSWKQSCVPSA